MKTAMMLIEDGRVQLSKSKKGLRLFRSLANEAGEVELSNFTLTSTGPSPLSPSSHLEFTVKEYLIIPQAQ
jgi:hypothetical protein